MVALLVLLLVATASAAGTGRAVPPAELVRLALNLDTRARDHIGLGRYDEAGAELASARARLRDALATRPSQAVVLDLLAAKKSTTSAIAALAMTPPHPRRAVAAIAAADAADLRALAGFSA